MPFVYSTATNTNTYVQYEPDPNSGNVAIVKKWPDGKPMRVTINGGHGLSQAKTFITPQGVATRVTDQELEWLLTNKLFVQHMEKGFLTYDKKKMDPSKKARDMEQKDKSAPITPSDYQESEFSSPGHKIYKLKHPAQIPM